MNVVISNTNRDVLIGLDIDIIKSLNGQFTVDEIVLSFSNFFFNRMILDVTSIVDYTNVLNLRKLSVSLDVSKIILYIGNDTVANDEIYISNLIDMGIYNFARNVDEVKYLMNNPNQYKDVAHLQKVDVVNSNMQVQTDIQGQTESETTSTRIIGFKNVTSHAGATSLIYMLKRQLSKDYYTIAIEVNKKDFLFFKDKDLYSVRDGELSSLLLKYKNVNVILIDLNDLSDSIVSSVCDEVIYLVEPSILGINKTFMLNNKAFERLSNFKVVLNDCLLNDKDVKRLGNEAGIDIFYAIPPMNDREDNSNILFPFLAKLGLYRKID